MTNTKQNQRCWECAHFQRYWDETDSRNAAVLCGECRRRPPLEQQSDSLFFRYNWAFILDGTDKWCGHYKRALHTVPDVPAVPDEVIYPDILFDWDVWNVKNGLLESCWNCNNFQRDEETPSTANGICQARNPNEATHIDVGTDSEVAWPNTPMNYPGDLYSCGSWEPATEAPPSIPATPSASRPDSWFKRSGGGSVIYVDRVNGDDLLGDGSETNPYQSYEFVERLPEKLYEDIVIKPRAGVWNSNATKWPNRKQFDPSGGGRIIIDASGETWPVRSSGNIIDNISPVGNAYDGYANATALRVGPAPGWANDLHYPYFAHMTSGNWAGYVLPIFHNDADTIYVPQDWFGFQIGDTFDIVDCPVTIDMPHECYIRGVFPNSLLENVDGETESPASPWLIMSGVHFQADLPFLKQAIYFERVKGFFPFCKFTNNGANAVLKVKDTEFNYNSLPAGTLDYPLFDSYDMVPTHIANFDTAPSSYLVGAICENSSMYQITTRYAMQFGGAERSHLAYSQTGGLLVDESRLIITAHYMRQLGFTPTVGIGISNSYVSIFGLHYEDLEIGITASGLSFIFTNWLQGVASDDYAHHLRYYCEMVNDSVADVTSSGAVGPNFFSFSGTGFPAWPAPGGQNLCLCGSIFLTA